MAMLCRWSRLVRLGNTGSMLSLLMLGTWVTVSFGRNNWFTSTNLQLAAVTLSSRVRISSKLSRTCQWNWASTLTTMHAKTTLARI
uniref:Putative secreted protein n=1 Tax=Ixodes ricinus TaxID=34613 RepID=A0A6B0UF51_IXORI